MFFLISDPGTPYQVRVVAFTSVGMGVLGDYVVFFSEELAPTKLPRNIRARRLNSSLANITWTPLSLFEAQGFPQYRVMLNPFSTLSQRRQIDVNVVITNNSFVVFTNLDNNTEYYVIVGVRTGGSSSFMDSHPINGKELQCTSSCIHTCEGYVQYLGGKYSCKIKLKVYLLFKSWLHTYDDFIQLITVLKLKVWLCYVSFF